MIKRIALFLTINILVLITINIILALLGVQPYIEQSGLNYQSLAIFCLVWGMVGSLTSLALSRVMAKWIQRVQVINPTSPGQFAWLVEMVQQQTRQAGLPALPEIGVYESPEVNAFATGPTQRRSLVAFSTGLLSKMSRDEVAGVCAHELAHIKNGDMITMTLIQGIANAFVMFIARVLGYFASQTVKDEKLQPWVNFGVTIVLQTLLLVLASIVINWFSRQREYRADKGGAEIAGRDRMVAALQAINRSIGIQDPHEHASLATMKISGRSRFSAIFSTHPDLADRIARLQQGA